jgi:hypothetical protein
LSRRIAEGHATFAPTALWAGEKRREFAVRYVKLFAIKMLMKRIDHIE